jgi:hypothetical protein
MAEPRTRDAAVSAEPGFGWQAVPRAPGPDAAVPGWVVPVWREGLAVAVLAPDYQRIVTLLTDRAQTGSEAMNCRQIADALRWAFFAGARPRQGCSPRQRHSC